MAVNPATEGVGVSGVFGQAARQELWRERLAVPTYTVKAAADLSSTKLATVSYWLRHSRSGGPLIPERPVYWNLSWYQLVEVAFVATMRSFGVSLQRIRRAREWLAHEYDVEYPFALLRLRTEGSHILMEADSASGQPLLVVADDHGQIAWERILSERYEQFDYEHDLALTWYPRGRRSPVSVDPRIAYGLPAVGGVPTRAIYQRFAAGEALDDLSEDYGLQLGLVIQALSFEGVGLSK